MADNDESLSVGWLGGGKRGGKRGWRRDEKRGERRGWMRGGKRGRMKGERKARKRARSCYYNFFTFGAEKDTFSAGKGATLMTVALF